MAIGMNLSHAGSGYLQDFNALGPPFAGAILLGGNQDFLARTKALCAALATLAGGHIFAKNDGCMGDVHAAQHVVAPLDVNPATHMKLR